MKTLDMEDTRDETQFLIISDTHDLAVRDLPKLPTADVVLHCGDITEDGDIKSYKKTIDALATLPAELKLVIAGNHDISLDRSFYASQGGSDDDHNNAMAIWRSENCRRNNIHYLEEGKKELTNSLYGTANHLPSMHRHTHHNTEYQHFNTPRNKTGTVRSHQQHHSGPTISPRNNRRYQVMPALTW